MTLPESPGARDTAKKALAVEFWSRIDTGSNERDKEIAANQAELMIQVLTDAGLAIIDLARDEDRPADATAEQAYYAEKYRDVPIREQFDLLVSFTKYHAVLMGSVAPTTSENEWLCWSVGNALVGEGDG